MIPKSLPSIFFIPLLILSPIYNRHLLQVLQGVVQIPILGSPSKTTVPSTVSPANVALLRASISPKPGSTIAAGPASAASAATLQQPASTSFSIINATSAPKMRIESSEEIKHRAEAWDKKIQQLLEFKALHGHTLVPQSYPENKVLGRWVSRQREYYAAIEKGEPNKSHLTQERIDQLNKIGFIWKIGQGRSKNKVSLSSKVSLPTDAAASSISSTCPPPAQSSVDERVEGLENTSSVAQNLSSVTKAVDQEDEQGENRDAKWLRRYDELCRFRAVYGHCLVPQHHAENKSLGKCKFHSMLPLSLSNIQFLSLLQK